MDSNRALALKALEVAMATLALAYRQISDSEAHPGETPERLREMLGPPKREGGG